MEDKTTFVYQWTTRENFVNIILLILRVQFHIYSGAIMELINKIIILESLINNLICWSFVL